MTCCWKIRRLPLIIILIFSITVILLHSILNMYLIAKYKWKSIQDNENGESPPTLESPIISVTLTPTLNWNKTAKSSLPWYFKDGLKVPNRAQINPRTGFKNVQIWPEEQLLISDRVEEQLMFVPSNYQYENAPMKKILLYDFNNWMVDSGISEFISNDCPVNRCTIISRRTKFQEVDAVVFREKYSNLNHKKYGRQCCTKIFGDTYVNNFMGSIQVWILFSIKSAYYAKLYVPKNVINWTVTYRHDSDIVMPYGRWAYYNSFVTQVNQLERNYAQHKTKQVAMFVTNCNTDNGRLQYARELGLFISVDVYGKCGNFKTIESNNFLQTLDRDYKFYLAFENSNCIDYVTEKFFIDGLQHNVLPIVMGGRREDYERMTPKRSYLHVDDYESPERLAEHLHRLDADDELYNEYFLWKGTGEFIDTKFFCRLCAMLHDDDAPVKHYTDVNDWWRGKRVCDNAMKWRHRSEDEMRWNATITP